MKKIIFTSTVVLFALHASAQTGGSAMSLQQCIDFAEKNSIALQNAKLDEQIAKDKVREVTGIGLPQINGNLDTKDFLELPTSLIPAEFFGGRPGTFIGVKFGTRYNTSGGFDASWLLLSSDYILGLEAAKTYMQLSQKAGTRTHIEMTAAVSKAYYSVLIGEQRMQLVNANVDRLKKLSEDTKALNDNGFVEKIDLDRVNVAYNNLLAEKDKIQRLLDLGYALLKFQ